MNHDIEASEEKFWKMFLDGALTEQLFKELGFPKWKLIESRDSGDEVYREIEGVPKMEVPGAVAKVFGPGFGYLEKGTFDKKTRTYRFKMKMNTMTDKLRLEGTVRSEPAGENKCRRVVEIIAEAKVFGIGGIIEGVLEKSFRDGWLQSAQWFSAKAKDYT